MIVKRKKKQKVRETLGFEQPHSRQVVVTKCTHRLRSKKCGICQVLVRCFRRCQRWDETDHGNFRKSVTIVSTLYPKIVFGGASFDSRPGELGLF